MNSINRGEIYWIEPSPYHDGLIGDAKKARPGIVVSNNQANHDGSVAEVVFLTTNAKYDTNTHCTIRSATQPSTALCEQITTISKEQLGRYIGTCTDAEMETVDNCLLISLGIEMPEEEYEIENLQEALIKAQHEAEVLRKLYNELLQKIIER